ncbi:hypothetical protein [Thermogutta sp.]|jgi:hypothetical protein|uniref:hypothetical protein n=1 Tax=Thermogutta sp. TaxID=1962930 RepID=UPI003C7BE448
MYEPRKLDFKGEYRNASNELDTVVARWNRPEGKGIRPVHKTPAGWKHGALPAPRILYRLPELLPPPDDVPVVVCEGEKAADAADDDGRWLA